MNTHFRLVLALLVLFALAFSACRADGGLSVDDPGDQEDAELEDPDPGEVEASLAEEGQAVVYYHYQMSIDEVDFNIETELPITFYQNSTGNWVADAMGGAEVVLKMMAGGTEAGSCQVICNLNLNMVGQGQIAPISDTQCQIPMSFQFVAQDDWILEGSCPDEAAAVIDCAALSLVMADPGIYTFTPGKSYYLLQKTGAVTQEAELKVQSMPAALRNECGW